MDGGTYTIRWDEDSRVANASEVICGLDGPQNNHYSNMQNETIIPDTDQIAAENLMFLAQDMVGQMGGYAEQVGVGPEYEQGSSEICHADTMEVAMECQVTEEVITDDWVVEAGGQERIEVPLEQLATAAVELKNEYNNDIDVPLPTDQDQYTAMRPWPCDFCSRRFRKKATLMNHMVAHQNDRPYGCNLCGIRYVRRADLMNHLKVHASVPELDEVADNSAQYENYLRESPPPKPVKKKRGKKKQRSNQNGSARCRTSSGGASATSARTQMYRARALPTPSAPTLAPAPPPPPSPPRPLPALREPTDPRKPFVCQHCGVGFAREKALASHSRIHGGDSPLDCGVCGELCWSRDALSLHMRQRHPDLPAEAARDPTSSLQDGLDSDFSLPASEVESGGRSSPLEVSGAGGQPELYCKDCGAGFQRADLLRRHAAAAHSYKKEPVSDWEYGEPVHSCDVCGESFRDALDLLAHAESHARNYSCWRCGSTEPSHECSSLDLMNEMVGEDGLALIPCPFCGKGFRNRARLRRHVCPARFADGSRMPVATPVTHNGAKQFPCRECGKTFGSRSSQQIHIRIHTGERPYGCRFCWKAFADGGTLRKHERIHTGEKPYACAVCPRAFNQRVVLREHVRSHHSAPDSRRGNGAGVFCCSVCSRTLHTSAELVQHLIQHCDANTAMKRQPQVGPRKYKRRRRLKPHEDGAEERRIEEPPLEEPPVDEPPVDEPPAPSRRRRPRRYTTREEPNVVYDGGDYELPDMEDTYSNIKEENVTIPAPPPRKARVKGRRKKSPTPVVSRPKMIHTQKSSPSTSTHTSGRKKRGRAPAPVTTHELDTSIRPRTKNVKYHDVPPRHPTATFPKREMLSDELADDLRAILLPTSVKQEAIAHTETELAMATRSIEMMAELKPDPDYGPYRCEMCSEAFHDREQLLLHVPIHI